MVYLHRFLKVNIETNVLNKRLDLFNYIKLIYQEKLYTTSR